MPVIVPCPSCSTQVSVRDEHVGRKLRCPKCKTDIDPSAVEVEEPPAAAPPSPPPPPPVPTPARTAPPPGRLLPSPPPPPRKPVVEVIDDDEYEVPRQPPSRKRRSRATDSGPPNSDAQAMIYVGGLVAILVVIGVSIAVYTLLIKPLMNAGTATASGLAARNNSNVTQANAQRIASGMTLAEVEAVLGKGRPATEQDFLDAQNQMNDRTFTESMFPWAAKLRAGEVQAWTNGKSRLMVGFTRPPTDGGTVIGVVAVIADGLSAWSVHFLDTRPGGTPGPGGGPAEPPAEEVVFADLLAEYVNDPGRAAAKYQKRWVKLTGLVKEVEPNGQLVLLNPAVDEGKTQVRVNFAPDQPETTMPPNTVVTVVAQVWFYSTGRGLNTLYMNSARRVR